MASDGCTSIGSHRGLFMNILGEVQIIQSVRIARAQLARLPGRVQIVSFELIGALFNRSIDLLLRPALSVPFIIPGEPNGTWIRSLRSSSRAK